MFMKTWLVALAIVPVALLAQSVTAADSSDGTKTSAASSTKVLVTKAQPLGKGRVWVYVALDGSDVPLALGVSMEKSALEGLPDHPNTRSRCFDKNGDGKLDASECIGDYELVFQIPPDAPRALPFKWVGLNWNPHGHPHPAPKPYAEPHFDFHFYMADRAAVSKLRPGACGELIDCDDFKRATKPVAARYVHAHHINVGAAVPDMGNHLIDSKSPELAPGGRFTHTFIYGAYDGRITFYEPMITHAYLASGPAMCAPIKQPQAWAAEGAYPTRYCVRYSAQSARYTVSLEGFVRRTGS
jgi:hypothetical protein